MTRAIYCQTWLRLYRPSIMNLGTRTSLSPRRSNLVTPSEHQDAIVPKHQRWRPQTHAAVFPGLGLARTPATRHHRISPPARLNMRTERFSYRSLKPVRASIWGRCTFASSGRMSGLAAQDKGMPGR